MKTNRYRIGLFALTGLFAVIAISSSAVGAGWLQGFLILTALIILLMIFILFLKISMTEQASSKLRTFWWDHFKPFIALPIAWGLLHLGFALMLPDPSKEIWHQHWKLLIVIELSAFVLNSLVNKDTPFEKKASRKLLTATYVLVFIVAGFMISCRLFYGEFASTINKKMHYKLMDSRAGLALENIEKSHKNHRVNPLLTRLDKLSEKAKKGLLSKAELKKASELRTAIPAVYVVLEPKKTNLKRNKLTKNRRGQNNHLSGIFKLPADGSIVNKDTKGKELWYEKGEIIQLQQLTSPPGEITFVNREKIPSWTTSRIHCTSQRAIGKAKVELMSSKRKELRVQVRILSRHRS